MMIRRLGPIYLSGLMFLAVGLLASWPGAAGAAEGVAPDGRLRLGIVSPRPTKMIRIMQPLAEYLAKHLATSGIRKGEAVATPSVGSMVSYLRTGKVDVYIDSPFPSVVVAELAGSKILLRRWKGGRPDYHTVFLARRDSGISSLEELRGKMIAFEDPGSTSAYFLPKAVLLRRGLTLAVKKDFNEAVAPGEVGYIFGGDETNILIWTIREKVHVTTVSNDDWENLQENMKKELKVVARTEPVPRHLVSVRGDLPPALQAEIRRVLVGMEHSEEGRRVLKHVQKTDRFDEFPQGAEAQLRPVRDLIKYVRKEVGAL
ncbi:MAG: phosphate/phosphite/phosphonate ABC transporter substrate-binding protein [Deltaproteobacteria bacterium]|nr:phosphate/phosphite/phosphonate ABC transporter substrate-binding protein [Deltaproteobacteria bacterium]